ncbi:MAG: bifunctional 4-hydroxy-3-methylbut-2-enyl diphosphate reductase/30S ribosomal protein S1 [Ruminococcaceae bacterium]|nr:bifunctional 4-hydroxy-3-methylbut-2-enyl diphosphate reductase/30S ribosomal protein S1 [Oscillospiraceae bacterium]
MIIEIASLAGFCFGVERAVDSVEKLISENSGKIYTLGKLIHNPTIVSSLEERGVEIIEAADIDRVFSETDASKPCVIVIRAHGVVKDISDKLSEYSKRNPYFKVCDMTCPHVKKIHRIVEKHSGDAQLTLILGNIGHPEVQGICSYVDGEYLVFEKAEDLDYGKMTNKTLLCVSQTTQKLSEWEKSQKNLKKVCTNALIFDTICSVTENRQTEVDALSKRVDLMLVIGGRDSSNTNKLYEISRKNQKNTFFIEGVEDLDAVRITAHTKVGIAAGASTPGSIIKEVKKKMSEKELTTGENFAELLDASFKTLNTGDTVTGTVLSVTDAEVHVDLGAKVTGIITSNDIIDPMVKLSDLYKVGDEVTAVAVRVSDVDGVATLSRRRIEASEKWESIVAAYNEGTILEGKVTEIVRGGAIIVLNSVKVFIPASQSGLAKDADLTELQGKVHKVKIIDINEQRKRAVASIRVVAREERKAAEAEFWATLEKDKKFTGKVKSLTSYGAFVNLGPVDGMVHLTELSWKRIKNPAEVVKVGDTLDVFVIDFDVEKKRISLGHKTEETNPWTLFTNQFAVGDVAPVKIVSMMPFGAFAEVIPGADGLIHISQIADKKIGKPADVLEIGQVVDAKIIDIDEENHKISLSMRALLEAEEEIEVEIVEEAAEEADAE